MSTTDKNKLADLSTYAEVKYLYIANISKYINISINH